MLIFGADDHILERKVRAHHFILVGRCMHVINLTTAARFNLPPLALAAIDSGQAHYWGRTEDRNPVKKCYFICPDVEGQELRQAEAWGLYPFSHLPDK